MKLIPENELRALVEKWWVEVQEDIDAGQVQYANQMAICADELSALIDKAGGVDELGGDFAECYASERAIESLYSEAGCCFVWRVKTDAANIPLFRQPQTSITGGTKP